MLTEGREKIQSEVEAKRTQAKLENRQFVGNAPETVVAKEREKNDKAAAALATLTAQQRRIEQL